MKFLAIDYGQKRVGIAVSDPSGQFAFPRRTLQRETRAAFFDELLALIELEKPEAIVVGLPLHRDGSDCLSTKQARNFAQSLKRRTSLPLYWMNEFLSSFAAESDLREAGLSLAESKKFVDQQAAVYILESFINLPPEQWIQI